MSKKKKEKKKEKGGGVTSISILHEVDKTLDASCKSIIEEIQDYQMEIYLADQKARKKERKRMMKDPYYFNNNQERIRQRKKVVKKMEETDFFSRMEKAMKEITPIIIVISRLVASLILTILSLDIVKTRIDKNTLGKMKSVYELARSIS